MASDVKVTISLKKGTGQAGFGFPLIFSGKETAAKPYTECSSLEDVETAFGQEGAVHDAASLLFMQDNRPEKIAVVGSTDAAVAALPGLLKYGWRQLIVASSATEGESPLKDIATYIETQDDRMFFATVSDLSAVTGENKIEGLNRTVLFYHTTPNAVAALVGATAGKKPGSFTYKNQILKGIAPMDIDDTQIEAAHTAGCLTLVTKAGDNVTSEGKTAGGEYIDIIDSKDWIIEQIGYQTQRTLNLADKVGYDNPGITTLENVCVNVLKTASLAGMIAQNDDGTYDYATDYAPRSQTSANDRTDRKYTLGKFSFSLAGAIHTAEINGTIEV
jgi:hypothetical protein